MEYCLEAQFNILVSVRGKMYSKLSVNSLYFHIHASVKLGPVCTQIWHKILRGKNVLFFGPNWAKIASKINRLH